MTTLRTTVIMKTDIRGSTVRFRALPEMDLDVLLTEHRAFLCRIRRRTMAASSSRRAMGSGSSSLA